MLSRLLDYFRASVGIVLLSSFADCPAISPADSALTVEVSQASPSDPVIRTVVDMSLVELVTRFPELKYIRSVKNEEPLELILGEIGANVETFFRDFPNTTCRERVTRRFLGKKRPDQIPTVEEFRYLILSRPGAKRITLEEERTDPNGRRVGLTRRGSTPFLTGGFALMSLHFHPLCRVGSRFRYLGRQASGSHCHVIAFAQKPDAQWPTVTYRKSTYLDLAAMYLGRTPDVTLRIQGIAFVDPATYQIVRMHTDIIPSPDAAELNQMSTVVRFTEVGFGGLSRTFWLPREAEVTVECFSERFRHVHRYSDYKLFTVQTYDKIEPIPRSVLPKK